MGNQPLGFGACVTPPRRAWRTRIRVAGEDVHLVPLQGSITQLLSYRPGPADLIQEIGN